MVLFDGYLVMETWGANPPEFRSFLLIFIPFTVTKLRSIGAEAGGVFYGTTGKLRSRRLAISSSNKPNVFGWPTS